MTSFQSKLVYAGLRLTRRKRWYQSLALMRQRLLSRRDETYEMPAALHARYDVRTHPVHGCPVVTMQPKGARGVHHVFYLHGGAYLYEIAPQHWHFLAKLVDRVRCTVTVPIYPLAPEHTHVVTRAMVRAAYGELAAEVEPARLTLMGDSAGGGLALSLAQALVGEQLPPPKDVVLIAPWLDLTVAHDDVIRLDRVDPWLSRAGLAEAGRLYAGGDDPTAPELSPLHGRLAGVGRLSVFVGTRDILLSDARRLRARAAEDNVPLVYVEEPDMVHVYPLIAALPEAARAFARISELVTSMPLGRSPRPAPP